MFVVSLGEVEVVGMTALTLLVIAGDKRDVGMMALTLFVIADDERDVDIGVLCLRPGCSTTNLDC